MQMVAVAMQTLEQIASKVPIFAEFLFVHLDKIIFLAVFDDCIVVATKNEIVFNLTFLNIAPTDIVDKFAKIIAAMRDIFLLLPTIRWRFVLQLMQGFFGYCFGNVAPIVIKFAAKFLGCLAIAHTFGAKNLDVFFGIEHACIDERRDDAAAFAGEVVDVVIKKIVADIVIYISKFWKLHTIIAFFLLFYGFIVRIIPSYG